MAPWIVTGLLTGLIAMQGTVERADEQDKRDVVATLGVLSKAMTERDVATLRIILHDGLSYGHSGGLVQSRAEVLEVTRTRGVDRWTFKNPVITIAGDTALVRANIVFSTLVDGYRNDAVTDATPNVLLVCVKGGGPHGWQVLGRQNFVGLARTPAPNPGKR